MVIEKKIISTIKNPSIKVQHLPYQIVSEENFGHLCCSQRFLCFFLCTIWALRGTLTQPCPPPPVSLQHYSISLAPLASFQPLSGLITSSPNGRWRRTPVVPIQAQTHYCCSDTLCTHANARTGSQTHLLPPCCIFTHIQRVQECVIIQGNLPSGFTHVCDLGDEHPSWI